MEKKIKKKLIIFLVLAVVGLFGFATSFIMYLNKRDLPKDNSEINNKSDIKESKKEEEIINTGDIVFKTIDESIYLDKAIPTLDKFGVMNEPFTFTIKNSGRENIKYVLKLIDDDSTIKNSSIRYELTRNNDVLGIFTLSDDGIIDNYNIKSLEEISYSIKVWIDYNSEVKIGKFSKKVSISTDNNTDNKIDFVNEPVLASGMIPVYYDKDTNSWFKSENKNTYNNEWYNYSEQKWANAVTVNEEVREKYLTSSVGTKIEMDDINAFFVWIPRFSYSGEKDNINITFVDTGKQAYPAFTFNDNSLAGFWVSKFESGMKEDSLCAKSSLPKDCNNSNNLLYYVPNALFISRMTMANQFNAIRKMELKNNIYGFKNSGTKLNNDGTIKNDNNNLDTHMIKNTEWQAVALLSSSKYGKTGNNNYDNDHKMIVNNASNYLGMATINEEVYEYNVSGKGVLASTTGNVYGIYDMSGGKREYVMINNNDLDIFNKKSNSGFTNSVKDYYFDNDFNDDDTTKLYQEKYSKDNLINEEPITRGGYKNTGNIFNVYSAQDYLNKLSLETNSRAVLVIVKEK